MIYTPVALTVGVSDVMAARLRRAMLMQHDFHLIEASSEAEAVSILLDVSPGVVVINADLEAGCPLSVADYVCYRRPDARVIYEMGAETGFADGSLFAHSCNAHGMVTRRMRTGDLGALVAYHASRRTAPARALAS